MVMTLLEAEKEIQALKKKVARLEAEHEGLEHRVKHLEDCVTDFFRAMLKPDSPQRSVENVIVEHLLHFGQTDPRLG